MWVKKKLNIPVTAIVLVAFIGVVIGIGFYGNKKAEPLKGDVSSTGPVSLEEELQKEGQVFYISPDGDDSNPGTQQSPFRTINAAIRTAEHGDTIVIKAKAYTGKASKARPT